MRLRAVGTGVAAVLLVVLGVATGLAVLAVYRHPAGLALGVLASLAVLVALPRGLLTRIPFAGGWVAVVGLALVGRPEGDFAVAGDLRGFGLLACGMVVIGVSVATLPARRARGRS